MTYRVYDSSDTLLEEFISNYPYIAGDTIQLSNKKHYKIIIVEDVINSPLVYLYVKLIKE